MLWKKKAKIITDPERIEELLTRGVTEIIIKENLRKALLSGERLRVKLGIDPTSPHLHLGRSIGLLKLRDFQELGHQIVLIVGDFTGIIGDTSDKDAERPMLSRRAIEHNMRTYKEQVGKLLNIDRVEFRHNSEWLSKLTYGDIGEHANLFSVSDFIARENIARRLKEGRRVSLREVLYPLMQGYDSVAVKADVELGGTDQKFNLLAGRALQQKHGQRPQNILMNPLLVGLDGRKMSSSWGNTIPLTAAADDMYGKIMSITDTHIGTYFELCTRVPHKEVERVQRGLSDGTLHPKEAKMRLAREIVTLYHGEKKAREAEENFSRAFSRHEMPETAEHITVRKGAPLIEALALSGLSKSEARRLIAMGAVERIGGEKITDPHLSLAGETHLKVGKKRFLSIRAD